ncbi:MAG: cytochrome oxidase subunit III [Erythrobacter sp.]|nr:cytochrome oxidase subunit III [Erythrobacter sp.]
MSIFSRLAEKSWENPGNRGLVDPQDYRPDAVTVGVYVYFGVATIVFTLMAAAYLVRQGMDTLMDHGIDGSDWVAMPEPALLWINTGVLVASSLAFELARLSARDGADERMATMTKLGGLLGLAFLVGQLILWRQFQAQGFFLAANPANAFFYLLTAAHGLHLAGGLFACGRTVGLMSGGAEERRVRRNVRLCAIYWHFFLGVWALLVALLVTT